MRCTPEKMQMPSGSLYTSFTWDFPEFQSHLYMLAFARTCFAWLTHFDCWVSCSEWSWWVPYAIMYVLASTPSNQSAPLRIETNFLLLLLNSERQWHLRQCRFEGRFYLFDPFCFFQLGFLKSQQMYHWKWSESIILACVLFRDKEGCNDLVFLWDRYTSIFVFGWGDRFIQISLAGGIQRDGIMPFFDTVGDGATVVSRSRMSSTDPRCYLLFFFSPTSVVS
jgi:hypothetical protein